MRHRHLPHALTIVAAIVLVIAFVNLLSGGRNFRMAGITAAIVIVLMLFEVQHYRPKISARDGWQRTNERFLDPESGERTDVYFNPKTGERDYRRSR